MGMRSTRLLGTLVCSGLVACASVGTSDSVTESSVAPTPSTSTTSVPTSTTTTITNTTQPIPGVEPFDVGPLAIRGGHSVVWADGKMIVWGGEGDEAGSVLFADGAAYDPVEDNWSLLSPAPISGRRYHVAAWTGEEMLIVGGVDERDGASYEPKSDTWRQIAESPIPAGPGVGAPIEGTVGSVWTGSELVVWHVPTDELASYTPDTDEWSLLPPTGLQGEGVLRWDGEAVYAFGTKTRDYPSDVAEGARLTEGGWEPLTPTEFSTETSIVSAVPKLTAWAGDRFLAWSGSGSDGKTLSFRPGEDAWTEIEPIPVPSCEAQGEPVQADDQIFAFGWCGPSAATFDHASQTWRSFTVTGFPTARSTVWTGTELLNWGDTCCYGTGGAPFASMAGWRRDPTQQ